MLTYILFIIGFVFLIKGADLLVDGSSSIAKKFGVSNLVIGLTIVAFGTSAPELVVNILASIKGSTELAIGNVVGSNLSNILLILGISAIIFPLALKRNTVWKGIPLSLLAVIVVGTMANDALLDGRGFSELTRIDGIVLISFFLIFIYYTFGISKVEGEDERIQKYKLPVAILMVLIGLAGLTLGGKWIVDGAIFMATKWGVSEALIGLTIVAIGTSLPELATSAMAAYRKKEDIAVGTIVGSNIFNMLWVLGISSIIRPLDFSLALNFDIGMVVLATFLLFIFMMVGKKQILQRWQGIIFVLFYVAYLVFLGIRG